jgi:hypothetical protein
MTSFHIFCIKMCYIFAMVRQNQLKFAILTNWQCFFSIHKVRLPKKSIFGKMRNRPSNFGMEGVYGNDAPYISKNRGKFLFTSCLPDTRMGVSSPKGLKYLPGAYYCRKNDVELLLAKSIVRTPIGEASVARSKWSQPGLAPNSSGRFGGSTWRPLALGAFWT